MVISSLLHLLLFLCRANITLHTIFDIYKCGVCFLELCPALKCCFSSLVLLDIRKYINFYLFILMIIKYFAQTLQFYLILFFFLINVTWPKYNMSKKTSNRPKTELTNFQVALLNIFRWTDDMLVLLRQNAKFMYWKGEGFPKNAMWNQEHIHATCVDYLILIWKVAGPSQGQSWRCLKTLMIL